MYILGINFYHNDTSVALIKDGIIVNAITEERLNRRKHSSQFPKKSIKLILNQHKLILNDIDYITVNTSPKITLRKIIYVLKNFSFNFLKSGFKRHNIKLNLDKIIKEEFQSDVSKKIIYIDHHLSHINSAFLISDFDECLSVSIDGFGDFKSSSYGISKDNKTEIFGNIYFPHSLGILYQSITQFIGFKNYGDEYKLMGLSAYGNNKYENILSELVSYKNCKYELNLKYFQHHKIEIQEINEDGEINYKDLFSNELEDLIEIKAQNKFVFSQTAADIAKSIQVIYENIFFSYLRDLQQKYDQTNLCLSGGCALNSLANGKIKNNTNFKKIFIPYEPADAGGSIGSALTKYYLLNQNKKKKYQPNPFLGIKYQIQDIEKLLISEEKKNKIIFEKIDDKKILCYKTAKLISDNKIIAWFQDRMEFGPRALGNRSILMDARNKNAKEILNSKVKLRENYRPFAPSILKEEVEKWFECGDAADYMTFVYKILENKRHLIPAVCHVDGTGRVQTVDKKINPTYYELIKSFYDITNVPLIINTSYNENEPIVNDPGDALETFLKTNLDYLVIENFIVKKIDN